MAGNKIKNLSILYRDFTDNMPKIKAARLALENEDYGQAISILEPLFETIVDKTNKAEIATLLGKIYSKNKSEFYSNEKAETYLSYARESRYPEGMYTYGILCLYGESYVKKDVEVGIQWLELAAKAGYYKANTDIANAYMDDKKDLTTALKYYKEAIKNNDPFAYFNLGVYYIRVKDYSKALEVFKMVEEPAKKEENFEMIEKAKEMIESLEKVTKKQDNSRSKK